MRQRDKARLQRVEAGNGPYLEQYVAKGPPSTSAPPTPVILDTEGKGHYRFTGFLPPFEFCAAIILNGAKTELDLGNYDLAIKCCDEVIEKY
jgi:hypothetical protein